MHLSDAWDNITMRRAQETPGYITPPLMTTLLPDEGVQQVVVTASKIPKPAPMAPINIPRVGPVQFPTDPWDQITARRASMTGGIDWASYAPYAIAALLAVAALTMKKQPTQRTARHVTRRTRG
jgi:hypothetical protein